jgi:hypothetical protein
MILPPFALPIVNKQGLMEQHFNLFINDVARLDILSGEGSPEGVVDAFEKRLYMDTIGTAGNILYIKRDSNIGGDPKQGWILV